MNHRYIPLAGALTLLLLLGGLYWSWSSANHLEQDVIPAISNEKKEKRNRPVISAAQPELRPLSPTESNQSPTSMIESSNANSSLETNDDPPPPPPSIPAVYGAIAPQFMAGMQEPQALEEIAQQFNQRVKDGGWDTTSASYASNWNQSASEANATLQAKYGDMTFNDLQRAAAESVPQGQH